MADAEIRWTRRVGVAHIGIRLCMAALAGGGAGLALLVLSWLPAILISMFFHGLVDSSPGFLVLGVVCGLAAGYTSAFFSGGWPVPVALGAWVIWALGIATMVATKTLSTEFGGQMLATGLVGALIGASARGLRPARPSPSGLVGPVLLGSLGAFALLALGVGGLGLAAQLGLRPKDSSMDSYSVYLRSMGAVLGSVVILAIALSAGLPVAAAGRTLRSPVTVAIAGLVLFLALGGLAIPALISYISCTAGLFGSLGC